MDLAKYGSDSDDFNDERAQDGGKESTSSLAPTKRKTTIEIERKAGKRPRKQLPALKPSVVTAPSDDPSLHQGRERARPFVQGEYNTHIYISLRIPSALRQVLNEVLEECHDLLRTSGHPNPLYSLLEAPVSTSEPSLSCAKSLPTTSAQHQDLHISLTHPLPLRHDRIQPLITHLRGYLAGGPAGKHTKVPLRGFRLSLASGLAAYRNGGVTKASEDVDQSGPSGSLDQQDYQTTASVPTAPVDRLIPSIEKDGEIPWKSVKKAGRAFLALRVAAGHHDLLRILNDGIEPYLRTNHLPGYHSNPEFHTSFAWTLVDAVHQPLTLGILKVLSKKYEDRIRESQPVGGWKVGAVEVKTGITVHVLELA